MTDAVPNRVGTDVPRIVAGSATDDEAAAVAAVFAQLLAERAASGVALEPDAAASQWSSPAAGLRAPWPARPVWGAPLR